MEIIDELEPTRRGLYGGAVLYLDFSGNIHSVHRAAHDGGERRPRLYSGGRWRGGGFRAGARISGNSE